MNNPRLPRTLATLSILMATSLAAFAQGALDGPPVRFSREGARVCAAYLIDGSRELYRDHVSAFSGDKRAAIEGLPAGRAKEVAGTSEILLDASFTACALAGTPSAPLNWIDQSCMRSRGICLPPRGFEIDAAGKALPLPPAKAAELFAKASAPPGSKLAGDGWSFKLNLKH